MRHHFRQSVADHGVIVEWSIDGHHDGHHWYHCATLATSAEAYRFIDARMKLERTLEDIHLDSQLTDEQVDDLSEACDTITDLLGQHHERNDT